MICPSCGTLNLPGNDACQKCQFELASLDGPMGSDRVEKSLMHDTVQSLKPRPAVTLPITATLGDVLKTLVGHGVGSVLLVGDDGKLRGILTERDFLRKVAGRNEAFLQLRVQEYMTPNPETISPTATIAFALQKMDLGGYRHLPVVEDGVPIGTISVRDMIRHITQLCRKAG